MDDGCALRPGLFIYSFETRNFDLVGHDQALLNLFRQPLLAAWRLAKLRTSC